MEWMEEASASEPSSAVASHEAVVSKTVSKVALRSIRTGPNAVLLSVSSAALLAGCSGSSTPQVSIGGGKTRPAFTESDYGVSSSPRLAGNGPIRKGGGTSKLGSPYKVAGRWYVPRHEPNYDRTGVGSWYGADFHGRKTANGEIFDSRALTAAHPTLPLPSYAYVTNLDTGRTIMVRVNDRGPYVDGRIIDLSRASADAVGYAARGKGRVRVRYAGPAPLNGDDSRERQYLARGGDTPGAYRPLGPVADNRPVPVPQRAYRDGNDDAYRPLNQRADVAHQPAARAGWDAASYRQGLIKR